MEHAGLKQALAHFTTMFRATAAAATAQLSVNQAGGAAGY